MMKRKTKYSRSVKNKQQDSIFRKTNDKCIQFSLTEKETKYYRKWVEKLKSSIVLEDEDCYVLHSRFQFSPFELGVRIEVSIDSHTLLVRSAWEDDEVNALAKTVM